jgi:Flp pilus assembly protein TadG
MLKCHKNRRGATAVEFALTAPIFFVILFAGIEFSRAHMIRSSIENAAFEGARKGIVSGVTATQCKTTTESLLEISLVKDYQVTVSPPVLDASVDIVSVTVSVPLTTENGFRLTGFLKNNTFTKTIELPREGTAATQ